MDSNTNTLPQAVERPALRSGDLLGPNVRVRTHLGEAGTVVGPHYIQKDWHHVRIDGAFDKQTPPRWIGELVECYRADELTVLP